MNLTEKMEAFDKKNRQLQDKIKKTFLNLEMGILFSQIVQNSSKLGNNSSLQGHNSSQLYKTVVNFSMH